MAKIFGRSRRKIRAVRFKVGMVFQYPEYQLFEETVYKDISFGPKNMGLFEEEIDRAGARGGRFCGPEAGAYWKNPPLSFPAAKSAGWPLPA